MAFLVVAMAAGLGWSGSAAAQTSSGPAAQVRFAESSLQATESGGIVRVLVERVDLPVSRLLVHYRTEQVAGAEAGADYAHVAGTLVFDVGVRSSAFSVPLKDDAVAEPTEHLLLHLETSSGSGASTRLTILDDDLPAPSAPAPAPSVNAGGAARSGVVVPAVTTPPVVVASSAGSSRPAEVATATARPRARAAARPSPAPRRIILRQTPTTPFELRPSPGSFDGTGTPSAVDPLLALAAGLLLARVGAELWFRARIVAAG